MVENSTKFIALDMSDKYREGMMNKFITKKGYEHDNGYKEGGGRHRELSGKISNIFTCRVLKLSGYIRFTGKYCRNITNIKFQLLVLCEP